MKFNRQQLEKKLKEVINKTLLENYRKKYLKEEKTYGKYNFKYDYDKTEEDEIEEMILYLLDHVDVKKIVVALIRNLGSNAIGVIGNTADDLGIKFPNED